MNENDENDTQKNKNDSLENENDSSIDIFDIRNSFMRESIIEMLYKNGSLSHKELAKKLSITPRKLSSILRRMEDKTILNINYGISSKDIWYSLSKKTRKEYDVKVKEREEFMKELCNKIAAFQKACRDNNIKLNDVPNDKNTSAYIRFGNDIVEMNRDLEMKVINNENERKNEK